MKTAREILERCCGYPPESHIEDTEEITAEEALDAMEQYAAQFTARHPKEDAIELRGLATYLSTLNNFDDYKGIISDLRRIADQLEVNAPKYRKDKIEKLLRAQIEEVRVFVDRCARDKGMASVDFDQWISETPIISIEEYLKDQLEAVPTFPSDEEMMQKAHDFLESIHVPHDAIWGHCDIDKIMIEFTKQWLRSQIEKTEGGK